MSEQIQRINSHGALLWGTNVIGYDSNDLVAATKNFLLANNIGHGVFDNVFKVVLSFEQAPKFILTVTPTTKLITWWYINFCGVLEKG